MTEPDEPQDDAPSGEGQIATGEATRAVNSNVRPAVQKHSKRSRKEWASSFALALFGLALIAGCSYELIDVFAEHSVEVKSLSVTNSSACRTPEDVALVLQVEPTGKLSAGIFPLYPNDGSQEPRCVQIASDQEISLSANPSEVWGDEDGARKPVVRMIQPDPKTKWWVTVAYFPVPPAAGRWIPHNKALNISFKTGVSRPTYTRAVVKMFVSFVPLLGPNGLSVYFHEPFEFKSSESFNKIQVKDRNINISTARESALFQLVFTDLQRERSKEITLLLAGGLLVLGFGCLVDLIVKLLELRERAGEKKLNPAEPELSVAAL